MYVVLIFQPLNILADLNELCKSKEQATVGMIVNCSTIREYRKWNGSGLTRFQKLSFDAKSTYYQDNFQRRSN